MCVCVRDERWGLLLIVLSIVCHGVVRRLIGTIDSHKIVHDIVSLRQVKTAPRALRLLVSAVLLSPWGNCGRLCRNRALAGHGRVASSCQPWAVHVVLLSIDKLSTTIDKLIDSKAGLI